MEIRKCVVANCKENGFILYGNKWICGECWGKIMENQRKKKDAEVEELMNGC